ncbi:hypothetical protein, conserved [Trypanosoma brucei gambiense DAL972]|uniref:Doublecortin domain-containing protein n=2 Tax=Trypanosoma brucei TaxID=5691 RepID=Q381W3_TRYB2|nr:hypothetical protein, conserved [Trypanosoma brucei gambiense DAL972]XP_829530.1 hypothetical protein, conserved [Trypanosoma brucei brucei TREU927]EAN80418.1 hypothetical protein, conserved [Trypanosoma brucei brucei TREU927]CBH18532.1 hypothetical protein, conserved [Trypanosoma brucei gambiense DAL972]|eukprot:XP_011780796.1 hypothetical protein, conserved [Trypanosoma brucei gambiense DAL972]
MIETPDASSGVYPQIHQIREMIREVSGVLESDLQVVREGWDKLRKARETIMKGFLGTNIDSPSVHSPRDRGTILPEDVELSTMEDGESMNDMCISEDSASDNSHGEVENVGRDDAAPSSELPKKTFMGNGSGGSDASIMGEVSEQQEDASHIPEETHFDVGKRSGKLQTVYASIPCVHVIEACTRPHVHKKGSRCLFEKGTFCVPQSLSKKTPTTQPSNRKKVSAVNCQSRRPRRAAQTRVDRMISPSGPSYSPCRTSPDQTFWINVWPCFGSFSVRSCVPSRIAVYGNFFYVEDVIERAAAATKCRPAPRVLYEPHGRPVCSVKQLLPEHHYLIYPGGALYRRENIPEALLRELIWSAKAKLMECGTPPGKAASS